MTPFKYRKPKGYVPPVGHEELLLRYARGERYFEHASLRDAILSSKTLSNVNLSQSDLSDAHLDHAALDGVDLTGAVCVNADFSKAKLYQCCFAHADLRGANWYMTGLRHVSLFAAQMDEGKYLECLQWSAANECHGLMPSVATKRTCFVSYASSDDVLAGRVAETLQRANIPHWFMPFSSWFGRDSLIGDRSIVDYLRRGIGMCDAFIVVLSPRALENRWVQFEIDAAKKLHRSSGRPQLIALVSDSVAGTADVLRTFEVIDCLGEHEAPCLKRVVSLMLQS
ncbi:MAG: toll/interleukin-1 receptor domain-containing protein [Proteobacteria bacterium]|nr:toll/interleukin-1 receptor domain-containing protein [Pseudomonadota bacterium]